MRTVTHKRRRGGPTLPLLFLAPIFLANVLTCLSISSMYGQLDLSSPPPSLPPGMDMKGNKQEETINVTIDIEDAELPSHDMSGQKNLLRNPKPLPLTQSRKKGRGRTQQSSTSNDLQSGSDLIGGSGDPIDSSFHLNEFCEADIPLEKVVCTGVHWKDDLPLPADHYVGIQEAIFDNLTQSGGIQLSDIHKIFPRLVILKLSFVDHGTGSDSSSSPSSSSSGFLSNFFQTGENGEELKWDTVRVLNLSSNRLSSDWIPPHLMLSFPQLETLDLSRNNLTSLVNIVNSDWLRLQSIDLSENPLNCTADFDWIEKLKLVNSEKTLCELPPHQNKPKPILKVYPLVKRVREECRLNCTCYVDYIWEQDKTIHAKTTVDCSHRNLIDFPDPDKMPHPTDSLYLSNNQIESLERFVEDGRYAKLNVMNLFLDDNNISSMSPLEGSEWFYHFQILSLRNNHIQEIPVYALENVLRQNKRLYFIDLSKNHWKCDCNTVQNFKVWLLRHSTYVKNVEDVRCSQTQEQVRHIKKEDWCKPEEKPIIEILDLVSITLAFLIVATILKTSYDFWHYKKHGRIPWLVSKM